MRDNEDDSELEDRGEEFLTIINMIGYVMGIARSLGVNGAVSDLQAARLKLATELQNEFAGTMSNDGIVQLSNMRSGHC